MPERQGRDYVALLGRAIRLADGLSVDDRFDLVVERRDDGTLGQLLYAGLDRVARADVELMKWTDGKHVIWVNADGVGGEDARAHRRARSRGASPRASASASTRSSAMPGCTTGVDLAAAYGSPIVAAADGRVVSAGWHGGYGQQVAIAHDGGLETSYGHMSRIAARRRRDGAARPGDRLCRLDRPVDRPPPPFRGHEERPPGQPAVGQARQRPRAPSRARSSCSSTAS